MTDPASSGRRRVGLAQFQRDMERATSPLRLMERLVERRERMVAELLGADVADSPPTLEQNSAELIPKPTQPTATPLKRKSRRGRKSREISADCETCLYRLAKQKPAVASMAARTIEAEMWNVLEVEWSYKTISKTQLYKDWRKGFKDLEEKHGREILESFFASGVEFSTTKPGRADHRKDPDYDPKHEQAISEFFKMVENANAESRQRQASPEDGLGKF